MKITRRTASAAAGTIAVLAWFGLAGVSEVLGQARKDTAEREVQYVNTRGYNAAHPKKVVINQLGYKTPEGLEVRFQMAPVPPEAPSHMPAGLIFLLCSAAILTGLVLLEWRFQVPVLTSLKISLLRPVLRRPVVAQPVLGELTPKPQPAAQPRPVPTPKAAQPPLPAPQSQAARQPKPVHQPQPTRPPQVQVTIGAPPVERTATPPSLSATVAFGMWTSNTLTGAIAERERAASAPAPAAASPAPAVEAPAARETEEVKPPVAKAPVAEAASPDPGPLAGSHLMIVGSHSAVIEVEKRILEKAGAWVLALPSWSDAVDRLQTGTPDLLLINDITADGWAAPHIHGCLARHHPGLERRIALTLAACDDEVEEFIRTSGVPCMFHPFLPRELVRFVAEALTEGVLRSPALQTDVAASA
ncbi:MAG TPA: hypothetical protein VFA60_03180 [Terriglobales bacterium]|nr:hypothetical protein [Terriglobales bacterium]